MSLLGGILQAFGVGAPNKYSATPSPDYKTDPNFDATQTYLKDYAEKMLQGNMPDWYKQIGEVAPETMTGGLVTGATNDIVKRALESGAATGTGRGGTIGADTMSAIGNTSAALRYKDWLRAMQGRQDLLNTGLNTEVSVRNSAFNNQNALNSFDQWKFGADVGENTKAWEASNARTAYTGGGAISAASSGEDALMAYLTGGTSLMGTGGASLLSLSNSGNAAAETDFVTAGLNGDPVRAASGRAETSGSTPSWIQMLLES